MILVLYHANCNDGWVAALQAYTVLGNAAEYRPIQYGEEGTINWDDWEKIFVLDFSIFPPPPRSVTLDHHATAASRATGMTLPNDIVMIVDKTKSGARLAQQYFGRIPSWLVDYAEDHDLWKFELPHSKEIRAGFNLIPRTFEDWLTISFTQVLDQGRTILKYEELQIASLAKKAVPLILGKYDCMMVNTGYLISDVGVRILEMYACDVAVMWFHTGKEIVVSLRSGGDINVAELAQSFGGGGHVAAAGFKITSDDAIKYFLNGELHTT